MQAAESVKFIREGRMGLPKTWKTGAVTNTYPTPMLVFNFDEGGLDVCQRKLQPVNTPTQVPEGAEVCYINCYSADPLLTLVYTPVGNSAPFERFVSLFNSLAKAKPWPGWRTVVLDPLTGLSDIILQHMAAADPKSLNDPRAWAYKVGAKVAQTIAVLHSFPCHTVAIMHAAIDKNELTGEVFHTPMIPSSLRDRIGMMFSQFVYQTFEGPRPVLYTQPRGLVKGIGCRWPTLPPVVDPTFSALYEAEKQQPTKPKSI